MPPKRILTAEQKEERSSEFIRDYYKVVQDFLKFKEDFLEARDDLIYRAENLKPSTVDQVTAREQLVQMIADA